MSKNAFFVLRKWNFFGILTYCAWWGSGPNDGMELTELVLEELLDDRILGRSGTLGTKSCEISTSSELSVSASDEDSS